MGIKKYFSTRVVILLIVMFLMLFAISPNPFAKGVQIKSVSGIAAKTGLEKGMIIYSINNKQIVDLQDFKEAIEEIELEPGMNYTKIKVNTDKGEFAFLDRGKPEIEVEKAKKSNLKVGLDLAGGTRVLIEPESDEKITDKQINDLISVLDNRLNVYGLSDLIIRSASDWEGNKYVLVEIAGVTKREVKELIGKQGKFEAKIGDKVVFEGGKKDITFVCRGDGSCSGVRPPCSKINDNRWYCKFEFVIHLSGDAAKRHADITRDIPVNITKGGMNYLEKKLDLYLDDKLVDSLNIAEDLKGQEATRIAISGPGYGINQQEAINNALRNMDKLQTILITGSLPLKINIVKVDTISPILGSEFVKNSFLAGLFALIGVGAVVFVRYRRFKIVVPMIGTMASEIFLILGFAAIIQWNLDMAAIAGIIAAVGTGVDDQIVIVDEVLKGGERFFNWKQRVKRAFFVIVAAYATTVAAMIPLWNAGAGLLRGFAITTIIGVSIGVFLTRPAFASIMEKLLE